MSCFLSYTSSITGDCTNTNSGAFTINIDGTAPDYTIQWLSPSSGTTSLGAGVTAYTQTNLSAGTYTFNIIDSCIPANTVLPVNIYVSSGTCVSITNIINTVCNSNNGSITALTSNLYGQASFYLYNDITGFIIDNTVNNNTYTFNNLSSGTYYVIADDGGGCTGKSESVIVKNSSNLSFGLYKVDNAGCAVDSGKLMITGLTGTPPYTYLWSNGGIMDNITGLTDGTYTVTVTDSSNCSVSNTSVINTVPKVGLGAIYLTQPSCFTADGEVEIIITGGTPPFYYLGSNGVTNVTFDRTVTFTGLGPGGFTIQVTDAGLCNFSTSTNLLTPNGMSTINVGITNSQCNDFSGIIGPITVFGGTSPYTYILTNSFGNTKTDTIYQSNWLFDGLSADTYNLTITDNGGCTFTSAYTINNQVLFGLTVSTTGTTCNGNNGSVYVQITSGGTPPYIYEINGSVITTTLTSYTFNNLFSGNYTASVTDSLLCKQSKPFTINSSNTVDFHLLGIDSLNNDGSITAYITNGQPPFTLYWSGDVGTQTGLTITNLLPGDYSLRVVDNNGCSKTKKITIKGVSEYSSTGYFSVCESKGLNQPIIIESGPKQILNEGYNQIILDSPGYANCILTAATFQAFAYVGNETASTVFYNSTGLLDYPSDELWYGTIQSLIESLPQIGNVDINPITNTIVVTTNCEESSLENSEINVVIRIDYEIACQVGCQPTPTQTPTNTPTPTPTSTPLPIMCFTYQGMYFSGVTTFSCNVTAENTLYNGKKWWSLTGCPTGVNPNNPLSPCPSDTGYVWWDGFSVWRFTSTLGGGSYYSYLNNTGDYPEQIISSGIYWTNTMMSTCSPEMINSFLGLCVPLTPTPTPTITPTNTKTPTPTPTNTKTPTPTPTITPSTKVLYYAYLPCGTRPSKENNVIIQPVPAIPGNSLGNVILDVKNNICWELINILDNLSQLQNIYPDNTYYTTNFFTEVYGTIFEGTETVKPCDECKKTLDSLVIPVNSDCSIDFRNWSDCEKSDTKGEVYINDEMVYSFNETFDVNVFLSTFYVNNGDVVKIHLVCPVSSGITFYYELTNGTDTVSITDEDYTFDFVVRCGEKPQRISIYSTCL